MKSRFRVLAALAALIALTLSFAEGVWASTCMPAMRMDAAETSAERPHEADCMIDMAGPLDPSGEEPSENSPPPSCPFIPVNATGTCAVAASLPAASPNQPFLPQGTLLIPSPDAARGLLLAFVFFHPPRA